jgi:hypothetical protein
MLSIFVPFGTFFNKIWDVFGGLIVARVFDVPFLSNSGTEKSLIGHIDICYAAKRY